MSQLFRDTCYHSGSARHSFIEFHLDEQSRKAFSTAHLITYSLDPNPDAKDGQDEPPQMLHFAFSTADIYILGWHLDMLADSVRDDKLYAVAAMPQRYADLEKKAPFVSSIVIKPISVENKGGD